jgi:hypothetical protein
MCVDRIRLFYEKSTYSVIVEAVGHMRNRQRKSLKQTVNS